MMMNSDEIIKVIDHLQDVITPIGVEVYEIYYKQILYTGIIDATISFIFIMFGILLLYKIIKYYNDSPIAELSCEIILFGLLVTSVLFIFSISTFIDSVMHIINPDYYVIQTLLGSI